MNMEYANNLCQSSDSILSGSALSGDGSNSGCFIGNTGPWMMPPSNANLAASPSVGACNPMASFPSLPLPSTYHGPGSVRSMRPNYGSQQPGSGNVNGPNTTGGLFARRHDSR